MLDKTVKRGWIQHLGPPKGDELAEEGYKFGLELRERLK